MLRSHVLRIGVRTWGKWVLLVMVLSVVWVSGVLPCGLFRMDVSSLSVLLISSSLESKIWMIELSIGAEIFFCQLNEVFPCLIMEKYG